MPVNPPVPDIGDQPVLFVDVRGTDGVALDPTDGRHGTGLRAGRGVPDGQHTGGDRSGVADLQSNRG